MKDINELMSQFDDLQDLPVSEEMLGAYIEGNLDDSEQHLVESSIQQDGFLNDLAVATNETDKNMLSTGWSVYDGDYGFLELGIPPVLDSLFDFSPESQQSSFSDPTLDELTVPEIDAVFEYNTAAFEEDLNNDIVDVNDLESADDFTDLL